MDILFQFTPLREGRRAAAVELAKLDNISIHAPAGGATCNRERCAIIISDFNSRPCGRGDECDCTHANRSCKFQFTPLREGRLFQSAHRAQVVDFNSRPCGRGDPRDTQVSPLSYEFQFTPLREGRRWTAQSTPILSHFNSRPCGRGDLVRRPHILQPQFISIHAPAGGATDAHALTHTAPPYFNSRPCGRGDSKRVQKKKMTIVPFAEKRGKFILL